MAWKPLESLGKKGKTLKKARKVLATKKQGNPKKQGKDDEGSEAVFAESLRTFCRKLAEKLFDCQKTQEGCPPYQQEFHQGKRVSKIVSLKAAKNSFFWKWSFLDHTVFTSPKPPLFQTLFAPVPYPHTPWLCEYVYHRGLRPGKRKKGGFHGGGVYFLLHCASDLGI